MSLLWHLIRNDLRHTRWPLLAWTLAQLLFAAASLAYWYAPDLFTTERASSRALLANGIPAFAMILVAFDFGVRLIQADNPALPHAFWRTRPIHPLRLLAAKLCTLLVALTLTALPALTLIACAFRDLPLHLLGTQYQFHLWVQVIPTVVALVFGSLTTSSRQCLLATILTFVGTGIFVALRPAQFTDDGSTLEAARMMVIAAILALTALVAVLHQFLSVRRARSLVIACLGLATALSTPWWWTWPLRTEFQRVATENESPLTRAAAIKTIREIDDTYSTSRSGNASLHYSAVLENLPASHAISTNSALHRWTNSTTSAPLANAYITQDFSHNDITAFLAGRNFPTKSGTRYSVSQSEEQWRELMRSNSRKHFSAELTFTLAAPEIIYTLPLGSRAPVHNGAGRAKIADANPEKGTVWVSAIAFTQLPPKPGTPPLPYPDTIGYRETNYALRHKKTGEQFLVSTEQSSHSGLCSLLKFRIAPPDKGLLPTAEWLENAELLVIATRPVAQFTRSYTTPEPDSR